MIDGHNDALEALRLAGKRLDELARIEERFNESERRREVAEAELTALGTEFMYCKVCNARFRFKAGFDATGYCFTCLGQRDDNAEDLEEQIAELHREIEFIDGPICSALIGAPERPPSQVFSNVVIQFGWLLCLMATAQRSDLFDVDDGSPEFCCSETGIAVKCWGGIACDGCGGCPLHCACEANK